MTQRDESGTIRCPGCDAYLSGECVETGGTGTWHMRCWVELAQRALREIAARPNYPAKSIADAALDGREL